MVAWRRYPLPTYPADDRCDGWVAIGGIGMEGPISTQDGELQHFLLQRELQKEEAGGEGGEERSGEGGIGGGRGPGHDR